MLASVIGLSQSISLEGCGSALFLPWFCYHKLPSASTNGAWPLRGHLQPAFLSHHHELEGLCHDDTLSLCHRVLAVAIFSLPFCNTWMEHFFCGVWPVLDLACATPVTNDILTLIISFLAITVPATFLFISYVLIISTILKIASVESWKKYLHLTPHMAVSPLPTSSPSQKTPTSRSDNLRDLLCHTFTESCCVYYEKQIRSGCSVQSGG